MTEDLPTKTISTDLAGTIADTAREKRIAALHAFRPAPSDAERPRAVYLDACRSIAQHFIADRFKYASSHPHLTRTVGEWKDEIWFHSSHHNVARIQVSLHTGMMLKSRRLARWRQQNASPYGKSDIALAGDVGLLHYPSQSITWNLADPATRDAVIADVVREIRELSLPFLERMKDVDAVVDLALNRGLSTLSLISVVELLLECKDRDAAAAFVHVFMSRHARFAPDVPAQVEKMRREGLPRWIPSRYAEQIALTIVHYHLPVQHD